jgi:ankyrin repeat protein
MNGLGTIVELLIAHGAKIDQVIYDDWRALRVACQLGKTNIVFVLLTAALCFSNNSTIFVLPS